MIYQPSAQHFDATAVRSAEEAIERLEKEPFDIVMLDLNLPKMSGLDLLQH